MNITIFGAKSIALGICHAVQNLYPEHHVQGFLVSSKSGNPKTLAGLPVYEIADYKDKEGCVLIAVPENIHGEIVQMLKELGFGNYVCMDAGKEAALMEQYYEKMKMFPSVHGLSGEGMMPELEVYVAKFYKDKQLNSTYSLPEWQIPIQAGASLTDIRVADICDNVGRNISCKNVNYCELTALYWMWKNCLTSNASGSKYYGLFHYRRVLDLNDRDIQSMVKHNVDVVLPFPMMCEPDIREHHARYLKEEDWQAMLQALEELQPEYAAAYTDIICKQYMYNYNMLIAKKQVLADYCAWLFPILERTEELSKPKGNERADRYIGYLGENLLTLYFMHHQKNLKIYHTGRIMLV